MDIQFRIRIIIVSSILFVLLTSKRCHHENPSSKVTKTKNSELRVEGARNITKKEVIERAKDFVRIYIEDSEAFFNGVENLMGNEIEAEFNSPRWHVFFSNGLTHINVELDQNANLGTISGNDYITMEPDDSATVYPKPPPPLYSLSEFRKVLSLRKRPTEP